MHEQVETVGGLSFLLVKDEPQRCNYLPDREATHGFILSDRVSPAVFEQLMNSGFRRSGRLIYRTYCTACQACRPLRVPVERFTLSRSQARVLRRNRDIRVQIGPLKATPRRLELYQSYQESVHDEKRVLTLQQYREHLLESPVETLEMSYWLGRRLVGVGIVDLAPTVLSSVYFYYDPAQARRSLGVYSALCEIEECRRRGLPWYHLGYYVAGCAKLEYKLAFRPNELLQPDGEWQPAAPPPSYARPGPVREPQTSPQAPPQAPPQTPP